MSENYNMPDEKFYKLLEMARKLIAVGTIESIMGEYGKENRFNHLKAQSRLYKLCRDLRRKKPGSSNSSKNEDRICTTEQRIANLNAEYIFKLNIKLDRRLLNNHHKEY